MARLMIKAPLRSWNGETIPQTQSGGSSMTPVGSLGIRSLRQPAISWTFYPAHSQMAAGPATEMVFQ